MHVSKMKPIKILRSFRIATCRVRMAAMLVIAGVFLALGSVAVARATALPAAKKSAAQIAQCRLWIQQAASSNAAEKTAAENRLKTLDSSWIPVLQRMARTSHSRVLRHRINALLERMSIAEATLPTLVSLSLTHATLRSAVNDLCNQAGLPHHWLKSNPAKAPTVTLHLTRVPFWQAMEAILHQSGWTLGYAGRKQGGAIEISPSDGLLWPAEPYFISGRYLFALEGLSFSRNFALTKQPANGFSSNNINFSLRIFDEPRAPRPPNQLKVSMSQVIDNNGMNLLNAPFGMPANLPPNMAANLAAQLAQMNTTIAYSNDHQMSYSMNLFLNAPKKIGQRVKLARGKLYWNLGVGNQKLRIKKLADRSGRSAVFAGFDIEFGRPIYHAAMNAYTIAMLLQTRQFLGSKPHTLSVAQLAVLNALQKSAGLVFSGAKNVRYVAQINNGGGYTDYSSTDYYGQPPTSLTCVIRVASPAQAKLLAAESPSMPSGVSLPVAATAALKKRIKSGKPLPVPASLVWTLPAFQTRVTVPFVFHNVPLPPLH